MLFYFLENGIWYDFDRFGEDNEQKVFLESELFDFIFSELSSPTMVLFHLG
jgi:hypothetical protein